MQKSYIYQLTEEELKILERATTICDEIINSVVVDIRHDEREFDLINGISQLQELYMSLAKIDDEIFNLRPRHYTGQEE